MSRVHVTPVVGLPQETAWSHVVDRQLPGLHFICALSATGVAARTVGRTVAHSVKSATFQTIEDVYGWFTAQVHSAQEQDVELACSCSLLVGRRMYALALKGTVFLRREDRVGTLVRAGTEIQVISGKRLPEDILILATEGASVYLQEVKQKLQQGFELDTIITSIIPGVQQAEVADCALAFISPSAVGDILPMPVVASKQLQEKILVGESVEENPTEFPPPQQLHEDQDSSDRHAPITAAVTKTQGSAVAHRKNQLGYAKKISIFVRRGLEAIWRASRAIPHPFSNQVYVQKHSHRRVLWWIVALLLTLLLIIGGTFWFSQRAQAEREHIQQEVEPLVLQLQAAQAQVSENPLSARAQAAQVVTQLEELRATHEQKAMAVEYIERELANARGVYESISGKEELQQLPVFYDLRLVKSDFVASLASGVATQAVLVDREQRQAVVLDLKTKRVRMLSLPGEKPIVAISLTDTQLFLLSGGVYSVPLDPELSTKEIIVQGDSNAAGKFIQSYQTFVYVLNPEKRNIYRYMEEKNEYSKPIGWLQSSLGVSLDAVTSLAVDGDLWLATQTGEVRKFTSGKPQEFSIAGMSEPFSSTIQVVTNADTQQLYVLEPEKHRLVVLSKKGEFLREFKNQSLGAATALVVSEELQKAFVLSGSLIFEIAL